MNQPERLSVRDEFAFSVDRRRHQNTEKAQQEASEGPVRDTPDATPIGEGGQALERAFPRFADDLMWWVEAAKMQRQRKKPPY